MYSGGIKVYAFTHKFTFIFSISLLEMIMLSSHLEKIWNAKMIFKVVIIYL